MIMLPNIYQFFLKRLGLTKINKSGLLKVSKMKYVQKALTGEPHDIYICTYIKQFICTDFCQNFCTLSRLAQR